MCGRAASSDYQTRPDRCNNLTLTNHCTSRIQLLRYKTLCRLFPARRQLDSLARGPIYLWRRTLRKPSCSIFVPNNFESPRTTTDHLRTQSCFRTSGAYSSGCLPFRTSCIVQLSLIAKKHCHRPCLTSYPIIINRVKTPILL